MFVMFDIFENIKRRRLSFTWHGLTVLFVLFFMLYPQQAFSQRSGFDDTRDRSGKSGGDLTPVDTTVDGGKIKLSSATQIVVLFRNDSGRPITTGAIQLYPSSGAAGTVSLNQCTIEPLLPGAVCPIAISVKAVQAGPWRIEMLMRHSGRSRFVTTTLSGDVETGDQSVNTFLSDIEAIPSELDFGNLNTSQPIIKAIVLRNTTSKTIDINAIYIEAAEQSGYSLDTDCTALTPGQACIVILRWSPVLKGQATGVLLIEHTGPTSVASVNLDGDYTPDSVGEAKVFPEAVPGRGLLVSSQDDVNFGSGIENVSTITVSLVNVGDAPLVISDISLAGTGTGLSVGREGCGAETVLEPVEACPLTVSWSPLREGSIIDDIQIFHDGARGVLVLPVRGTSSASVSQDRKAVRLAGASSASIPREGIDSDDIVVLHDPNIDPASVLDGFVVTSLAATRAIIAGPGGSRIVFDNEEVVLGGFLWNVRIRSSGVVFKSGDDKVLLLFDRSLSSLKASRGQSSGNSSGTVATALSSQ